MLIRTLALAAALSVASVSLASAQSVDPNPADRGYPAYAQPNFSGYYMGQPQGAAVAPQSGDYHSRPAALPTHRRHR